MLGKKETLIGHKYGRLTVKSFNKTYKNRRYWNCTCACGKITVCSTNDLRSNNTKSCGCLNKELTRKRSRKEKGHGGFTRLYNRYKSSAKQKNHTFELTKDNFKKLTKQNCHYCGKEPCQEITVIGKRVTEEGKLHSKYVYNGVDRKNNDYGYTKINSIPCCSVCNYLKLNKNYCEFVEHIHKISDNLRGANGKS